MRKKLVHPRYLAYNLKGKSWSGETLRSVQRMGPLAIIDYHEKRICFQGVYPEYHETWEYTNPQNPFTKLLDEISVWFHSKGKMRYRS